VDHPAGETSVGYATPRLDVRPWRHDEVEAMYDIYRRWEVVQWLGASPAVAESPESMHATVDRWDARREGPYGVWAVVLCASGHPVGTVVLAPMPDAAGQATEQVEVGWHLHPDHWGNGYATEAAQGALVRAWAASVSAVYAVVRPGNEPSVAVVRRLGMRPIGRTDRWYGVEMDAFSIDRPAAG
jgi:RimJ/RimL family protein N-acetyltransferase